MKTKKEELWEKYVEARRVQQEAWQVWEEAWEEAWEARRVRQEAQEALKEALKAWQECKE